MGRRSSSRKQPTVRIESSDEEDEDDVELLVDWRGKPLTKTFSSSKRRSRSRSGNRNRFKSIHHKNPPAQFDPQICRSISFDDDSLHVMENTPEPSVSRPGIMGQTSEMPFTQGSTPSVVLETPVSAQLNAKATIFTGLASENGASSFPRRLNKCSGRADVICLDSDNESDRHDSGASKEERPIFDASGTHTIEELQKIAPSSGDAIRFLSKRLNSEEQYKNVNSGEEHKEDQLMTPKTEVDNGLKKVTFESVSKATAHEFTEERTLYKAEEITKAAEVTISELFHLSKDEKVSAVESIRINSDARELGNAYEEAIDASMGSGDFSVLEVSSNIRDMGRIESSSRERELSDSVVKTTWVNQNSSEVGPSLDLLDYTIYMKDEGIKHSIDYAESGKDNGLHHNSISGTVEQQVQGRKVMKPREENKSQNKTNDLAPKETGNKRQRKDREIIRRDREEERIRKQEEIARKKREKEEEKQRQKEEKRLKMEEEKMQKASAKAEAADMRKRQNEIEKWEKGRFALKSISAQIDTKVVERGLIGGHLLSRLAEKELCFHIVSNQVPSSILWKMNMPDADAHSSFKEYDIPYILVVLEAEEFCTMVSEDSLSQHAYNIQRLYPGYSICYLTNKLMSYITKRDQEQYKNPGNTNCWRHPPVEQALARFVTHFVGVRSRLCLDEAEVADHIVGLTRSLAECQFRRKLTHLSISANGSHVPKDYSNKDMIKKSVWLKALVAIPKLPPKCAVTIAKKYPTMRSLLNVYLDPGKTVHEKEFLLQDLITEGLLGEGGRRLGPVCSKRVYRILMAQSGNLKTDDVEEGADLFQT